MNEARIIAELDRVCASSEFRGKPVMKRMLSYLVREHIGGRASQIKGLSIAVDVFDQGKYADSDKSSLVRNNAVRLRALLKSYYTGEGRTNPIRIDIPKGGYAPLIVENDENGAEVPGLNGDSPVTSVAVLPFQYQSVSGGYEFVANGFQQELADALTKFDDLRVIGVNPQIGLDNESTLQAEEISNKRIDYTVGGVFKIDQGHGTVLVRLIDAANNHQVWKTSYSIDLLRDSLFQVVDELSGKIASHIGGEYGRINQSKFQALLRDKPRSLTEQQVLLKYYHSQAVLTAEATIEFQETLADALQKDPDSAVLNALEAGIYMAILFNEYPGFEDSKDKISYHAEKAYALNPHHQFVAGVLGGKSFIFDERDRFFSLYEKHRRWLANSPIRLGGWAIHIFFFGEWELGMQLTNTVLQNNIEVPPWIYGVPCIYHYRSGNYEDALFEANKYHIPGLYWGPALRCSVLGQLGHIDQAKREYRALLECRPDFPERGRILMGRFFKAPGLLDHVVEGFEKMGVSLA